MRNTVAAPTAHSRWTAVATIIVTNDTGIIPITVHIFIILYRCNSNNSVINKYNSNNIIVNNNNSIIFTVLISVGTLMSR